MLPGELRRIRTWFDDYAARFAGGNGVLHPFLKLKYDHSFKVAENSRRIALALGWSEEDALAAEALGLLHDTGRFTQFAEFGSFIDAKTIDHGERGWEVIRCGETLAECSSRDQKHIMVGVRYHNRKDIPDHFDADTMSFLKLIRDADKIDIMRVVNEAAVNCTDQEFTEMFPGVTRQGGENPEFVAAMRAGKNPSFAMVKTLADIWIMLDSWRNQLNFEPSRELLKVQESEISLP
ncbi:MAG: HD domain-containing protein [Kiritimatiellia bacterium]